MKGTASLLLTPFRGDGTIDWPAYRGYVEWHAAKGASSFIFAVCGTSEMKWLEADERLELARVAVELADGLPVVATANLGPDISLHADEVRAMEDTGLSGVVLVPPAVGAREQTWLLDYYMGLVSSASGPVLFYEWPQVDSYLMPLEVWRRLAEHERVLGIKDTTCELEGIRAKVKAAPRAMVYQANTPLALESARLGVQGMMAITSAACPDLVGAFWDEAVKGTPLAAQLHARLVFLDMVLRACHPVSSKYLAQLRGLPMGLGTRAPTALSNEMAAAIRVWHAAH